MEYAITALGPDVDAATLNELSDWLQASGMCVTLTRSDQGSAETLSVGPEVYLSIILGSAAAVELVRTLHAWINSQKHRVVLTIEGQGKKLTIESDNNEDENSLIRRFLEAFERQ